MNNAGDIDMAKLMSLLSKMDKKDLENGIAEASKLMSSGNKDEILKKLNNIKKQ